MPANLENLTVTTGLEKISFHSNPKERQCQRMFKLPHYCTHLTHQQSNVEVSRRLMICFPLLLLQTPLGAKLISSIDLLYQPHSALKISHQLPKIWERFFVLFVTSKPHANPTQLPYKKNVSKPIHISHIHFYH